MCHLEHKDHNANLFVQSVLRLAGSASVSAPTGTPIHSVVGVPFGAETEAEPAKRKTDWTRFALWSVFDGICCYVILMLLYRAVSELLLPQ